MLHSGVGVWLSFYARTTKYGTQLPYFRPPPISRFTRAYSGKALVVPVQQASPVFQKKDKSPIRRSFRNLISVFKKATTGAQNDTPNDLTSAFPALTTLKNPPLSVPITQDFSGPLLYLLRPPCPPEAFTTPRWITCTATLQVDRIMITPITTQSSPVVHTIYLSHCADVRSLTLQQLDSSENLLLMQTNNIDELRVFEILFEGRVREKFAAISIRERAGWVSAIWEAILPSQEPNDADRETGQSHKNFQGVYAQPELLENTAAVPLPLENHDSNQFHKERLLPPIPSDPRADHQAKRTLVALRDQSRIVSPGSSPSIYPPSRSASRASPKEANPRSSSPSIVNLGRLSVVQERLAQIERNNSQQSSDFRLTCQTSSSRGSHLTAPSLQSGKSTIPRDILELKWPKHTENGKWDSVECALDLRGNKIAGLPSTSPTEELDHVHDPESTNPQRNSPHFVDGGARPRLGPFAELLQDHAAKNYDQAANLCDQIISLQDEVQRLPQELASVVSDGSSRTDIHKMISSLEAKTGANGEALRAISEKLSTIGKNTVASDDTAEIRHMMQDIREQLNKDIPVISRKLDVVQETQEQDSSRAFTTLKNLGPSPSRPGPPASDLAGLHEKVDALIILYRQNSEVQGQGGGPPLPSHAPTPELAEIRTLLEEGKGQGILQGQQQAENVRYLNELNTWLETFVNNGTSQIRNVSLNIEKLLLFLGCDPHQPEDVPNGSSRFLAAINQSFLDIQARNPHLTTLQSSMDGLLAAMNESQKALNMTTIASLIDRQRQDQEGILKVLTGRISDEIKGERLRFVEAMKEATAINVQIHVEQFKTELSREVSEMTEQVGRLHRERQAMETQIADLFTFYAKQKEAVEPPLAERTARELKLVERRPLPEPRQL